ncbi:MAG: CoA transferase [Pseudomonadota bacterium]
MLPLENIRVVDFTHVIAGPFCAYQLAVLGADVIKIESPHAPDMVREDGVGADSGRGSVYMAQNAGKRSIAIDLKTPAGRDIALDLIREADVVIENYRAGALSKLGLGYEDVRTVNPRVVYCSLTGFGQNGPKGEHTAYDNVIQAFSGLMAATGSADTGPVKVGPPVLDYGTGAQAAFAIAAALYRRERTGEGTHIDIAMLDAALMLMSANITHYHAGDDLVPCSGNSSPTKPGYGCYETANGLLMIGAYTSVQHVGLWRVVGVESRANDLDGQPARVAGEQFEADVETLRDRLKQKTADEWEVLLNAAKVPAARVRTVAESLGHPQIAARSVVQSVADNSPSGPFPVAAFRYRDAEPSVKAAPPHFAEHTREILSDLGYNNDRIDELLEEGVIAVR